MSTSSQTPDAADQGRAAYISGIRAFADFLESTPSVPVPNITQRFLLPQNTNAAVEEFAAEHGSTVTYDSERNASTELTFGPVRYHVYGYEDFHQHIEQKAERDAREWAAQKGLEIRPAESAEAVSE